MESIMTPFKAMKGLSSGPSSDDVSMDADDSHCSESSMLFSPPKAPRTSSRTRHAGVFASRLFGDEDEEEQLRDTSYLHKKSGVLKPLDLNLELSGEAAETNLSPRKPPSRDHQRKRHAEHHIGRDLSFDDADSPVDMHASPRISPQCYRSPSNYRGAHKSPLIRTLDGRTVQSKNPFSPMYVEEEANATMMKAAPLADSLTFPVSFEDEKKKDGVGRPLLLRHRLQKRDSLLDPATFRSESANYSSFTRDGYPEKKGQYSFTGSPIKETDFDHHNSHKVRRRTKGEDVAAAASHVEPSVPYKKVPQLQVDTKIDFYNRGFDEISPTDVFNFPMTAPSSPTDVPPTPSKPKHYRRRPKTRYTPVRNKQVAPHTPMLERRSRARSFDEDLEDSGPVVHQQQPQSRFYTDFDVIGELGKGSFGNVFKVLSRLDGCMYAIKVANRPAKGISDKDRMLKEVYALAALSDQADTATFHIVRYHQAWMEEHRLYIQTELCTSTLSAEMKQSPLSVERRYKFLREMCLALEYIHKHGMVHLDIKPENIFIKNELFKLGDFGLVSTISSHDVEEGDSRYMSIELLSGDHADLTKSDIFSLGITMYELCLGGRPLPSNGPEWQALRSANIPQNLPDTPGEMQRILELMMNPSFGARPSASDLLKRPQLLSFEQKALLAERNKVVEANLALAAQANRFRKLPPIPPRIPPPPRLLVRASTWNGSL